MLSQDIKISHDLDNSWTTFKAKFFIENYSDFVCMIKIPEGLDEFILFSKQGLQLQIEPLDVSTHKPKILIHLAKQKIRISKIKFSTQHVGSNFHNYIYIIQITSISVKS